MKKVAKTTAEKVGQMLSLLLGEHFPTPIVTVTEEYTTMIIL